MRNRDIREAQYLVAERQARATVDVPPCPNCGGVMLVDLIEVTAMWEDGPRFVPGDTAECLAQCYLVDPVAYLAKVRS